MKLFFKKVNKLNGGFTLLETLVAISIFSVSLLGIMSVLASGVADTNYAKRKMTATYLAQEGIEYIRNMRDTLVLYDLPGGKTGWKEFRDTIKDCGNHGESVKSCYFDDQNSIQSCGNDSCPVLFYDSSTGKYNYSSSGESSGFIRTIQAKYPGGPNDDIEISSTVSWTQGSGAKSVTFSENLFDWIEIIEI